MKKVYIVADVTSITTNSTGSMKYILSVLALAVITTEFRCNYNYSYFSTGAGVPCLYVNIISRGITYIFTNFMKLTVSKIFAKKAWMYKI